MPELPSLSIVLPCHNEDAVIEHTHTVLSSLVAPWLGTLICDYEIIMVNNGSTDTTLGKMRAIADKDLRVVVLDLRKNFGYQASISAGLFEANKDMVVSLDADLQDDPDKIKDMIEYYKQGYEMVLGVRKNRNSDSFFKRHSAHLFYKLLRLLGVESVPQHGDFRLLSHTLVQELKAYPERNRYLRGLIFLLESRFATVEYDRRERKQGYSKFSIKHLFSLALDGIFSFSNIPIRLIFLTGFFLFFCSILVLCYVLYQKFIKHINVPGWAFLSLTIMFFGGLQCLFLGILGEYLGKTYMECKQRPLFSIRSKYRKKN